MARRDRRRGGAHSAKRRPGSTGTSTPSAADPEAADIAGPAGSAGGTGAPSGSAGSPGGTGADMLAAMAVGSSSASGSSTSGDLGTRLTRKERRESASGGPGSAATVRRSKPKRTWLDWVLLSGVVLVSLAIVAVGSGYVYVQYRFNQVTKVSVKHLKVAPVGAPFNVLLIGSDSRVGVSNTDQNA